MEIKTARSRLTIPNLAQSRIPTPIGTLSPTARQIRHRAKRLGQGTLDIHQRVRGRITRHDPRGRKPLVRGHGAVPRNGRLKKVDNVLVLDVLRAVAGNIKGAVAGGVLGELMAPKVWVGLALGDPVLVHVGEEIVAAKGLEKGADVGAVVGGDVGGVAVGGGVVLAAVGKELDVVDLCELL